MVCIHSLAHPIKEIPSSRTVDNIRYIQHTHLSVWFALFFKNRTWCSFSHDKTPAAK